VAAHATPKEAPLDLAAYRNRKRAV
jgi:hypothetical protein